MSTITVSHSKIKSWRRCHKLYDYKYIQGLKPRRKARPLVFGSICHEMIEAKANKLNPATILEKYKKGAKKLFSAEVEEYMQTITDAETVMAGYFNYYKEDGLLFVPIKKKRAEHAFEVTIAKGIILKGKIDAVMEREDDETVWLGEHKTHKKIPDENQRFSDVQTVIYLDVLPDLGIKNADGVLWDYIRSSAPTVPRLLKDGTLSKAQIDTTPTVYRQAIKDNKLKEKDYADKLKELEGNEKSFYQRVYLPVQPALSKQVLEDTITTAREMMEKGGSDNTRNLTKDCGWCEFQGLCKAELMGLDADFIRKREYETREEADEANKQN